MLFKSCNQVARDNVGTFQDKLACAVLLLDLLAELFKMLKPKKNWGSGPMLSCRKITLT